MTENGQKRGDLREFYLPILYFYIEFLFARRARNADSTLSPLQESLNTHLGGFPAPPAPLPS